MNPDSGTRFGRDTNFDVLEITSIKKSGYLTMCHFLQQICCENDIEVR